MNDINVHNREFSDILHFFLQEWTSSLGSIYCVSTTVSKEPKNRWKERYSFPLFLYLKIKIVLFVMWAS